MAPLTLRLTIRVAWWVQPYLMALKLFTRLFKGKPDFEVVQRRVLSGVHGYCGGRRVF